MTDRDEIDEIEKTRRLVKDLRGDTIDKRVEFNNLNQRKQKQNPDGPAKQATLDNEKLTVETEIAKKGIYTDAQGNEQVETITTDTKTVTLNGRNLIVSLLSDSSTASLDTAKIGSGYKAPRRNAASLDTVLKTADTFNSSINSNNLEVTARFNDLTGFTNDTTEVGLFTDNGTLLQYDQVSYNFID